MLAKAESNPQGLVTLSDKLPKQAIKPLALIKNKDFNLYSHPFNSEVYWVVKDSLFDSSLDNMTTYGFSISLPSEKTIKWVYDDLDKLIDYSTYYFNKTNYCKYGYINKSKSDEELIIKLYFNNQLFIVSGHEPFIKKNLDLTYYCNW